MRIANVNKVRWQYPDGRQFKGFAVLVGSMTVRQFRGWGYDTFEIARNFAEVLDKEIVEATEKKPKERAK
jgi:hypothetical protein